MFSRRHVGVVACVVLTLACGSSGTEPSGQPAGTIVGAGGGTVISGGLTLNIPAGALSQDVEITVEEVTPAVAGVPPGFLTVGAKVFDLGPDGLSFAQPVSLTLRYAASSLPAGVAESELGIVHLTGGATVLASTVDVGAGTVTALVDHFSGFGIGLEVGELGRVACPALVPATTAGVPLDRIALGRLPTDFGSPLAAVVTADDPLPQTYALITVSEAGDAELVVPIHPSTDPAGGTVRLNVTDGTRACAAIDFIVEPLSAASGELAGIIDAFQALLDAQAALLETTTAELLGTPVSELPTALVPLALLQSVVDDPDNDRSLRALADGTSPDIEAARLDLVEPLLARSGIRVALETATMAAPGGPAAVSARGCTPGSIDDNAGLLDDCMRAAAGAQFELGGASGKVLADIGTATGILGVVPGLAVPATVAGAVAWGALSEKSRTAALMPSVLTGITVNYGAAEFREDEDGPGTWSAEVTAANVGYDLGKEVLEGLLQATGVAGLGDAYQVAGAEVNGLLSAFLTGPVAADLLENGTVEGFQIPAETFGPVDVSAEQWSQVEIIGTAFAIVTHNTYEPRGAGTAQLSVRTRDGAFGGNQESWQGDIEVLPMDLDITPSDVNLGPSEPQGFTVTVSNAIAPDRWEVVNPEGLQGTIGDVTVVSEGVYVVDYTAPASPNPSSPDLLVVRSTADTGARAYATEERTAVATIRFGQISIAPLGACLDPNQTMGFTAQVVGLSDQSVEWSADVGTIDPTTGQYTAPAVVPEGGVATITATSTVVPGLVAQVFIQLGGCSCSWSVSVDGNPLASQLDDLAGFQILDGLGLWTITLASDGGGSMTLQTQGVAVGLTGSFGATASGTLGLQAGDLVYGAGQEGLATLVLNENDGQIVDGAVNGTVTITPASGDPPQPRQAPFSASFRVVSEGTVPGGGLTTHSCTVQG